MLVSSLQLVLQVKCISMQLNSDLLHLNNQLMTLINALVLFPPSNYPLGNTALFKYNDSRTTDLMLLFN